MSFQKAVTAIAACVFATLFSVPALAQDWVERSNAETRLLIDMEAQFTPEFAWNNGVTEYDGQVSDFGPDLIERQITAAKTLLETYRGKLAAESDPLVAQDLSILIAKLERDIEGATLQRDRMLQWIDVPELVFQAVSGLLSEQTDPARHKFALELVQRYTGLYRGEPSRFEQARALWQASQGDGKIGPYRGAVEDAVGKYTTYARGIRALFDRYGIEGAQPALDRLDREFNDYAVWTTAVVLPQARDDFRLPPELYAFSLKSVGIDEDPQALIPRAKAQFAETRSAMQSLAPEVAAKFGFEATDYRDVIRELKRDQVPADELEQDYARVLRTIEEEIAEHGIVTLPDYPVKMRIASEAEAAAQPAPHMQPPPLIGNTGQQGVFVLTSGVGGSDPSASYDDFSFDAAMWTLSAHEGRPGHELQFAAMVDRGVSIARGLYAFNSVNVEGWALYAEAEMVPHEPVEGQLIALQHRLLRAARAFLDPMLNLGLISVEEAEKVLLEDVVLSPAMAKQEIDRYTFNNPGQAASYFYGYSKLLELREQTELALGENFDRLAFNDFILGQGLLPPDQLASAVENDFIPSRR